MSEKQKEYGVKLNKPHINQEKILKSKARFRVVPCGRRFGKDLDLETPIFSVNKGWVTVGDLEVGDFLIGSNGKPTKVTELKPIKEKMGYKFTFSTKESIISSKTHDWLTWDKKTRKNNNRNLVTVHKPKKRTSQEIVDTFRVDKKQESNHAVPVIPEFNYKDFETEELKINPYILGCWLGDGISARGAICGIDDELINEVINLQYDDWKVKTEEKKERLPITLISSLSFLQDLKYYDLIRNKHIPKEYLLSNGFFRRELLRGILDTDGYIDPKTNSVDLTLKDNDNGLMDDICQLIRSLGIRLSIKSSTTKTATNGKEGNVTNCFRINFTPKNFNPFKLSRKRNLAEKALNKKRIGKNKTSYRDWIYFTGYEEIEKPVLMRCITVDAEDHLFAVGRSMILTHNSEASKIVANIRLLKQGQHIWFCSPTNKNSKRMFRQFINMYKNFPENVIKINKTDMRIDFLFNGGWIEFISLAEPDNLRGEGLDFVIIDEAAFVQDHVWDEIISPMLLTTKGDALFISSTNGRNWFWRMYNLGLDENEPDYESFKFTTYDNPLIDKDEIDKIKRNTPSYVFDREYMAVFEEDGGSVFKNTTGCVRQYDYNNNDDPLLTKEDYEQLCEQLYLEEILLGDTKTIVMGVDWAQMNDYTVVTVFDVERNSLLEFERINRTDWETMRQVIIDLHDKWQPLLILAEENNNTANIEALQKEGYPIEGFKTTHTSKPKIINSLALQIEQNNISIPNDKTLLGELNAYSMTQTSFGNIKYGAPTGLHDDIVMSFAICYAGSEMVLIPEAFSIISV